MPDAKGIVVAHCRLAEALVEAAEQITGISGALQALSNQSVGPADLKLHVAEAIGDGPAVVFVDLASGSCGFAANLALRECSSVAVVTGVSLPMLIDFLFHRDMELPELAGRLVDKGRLSMTGVSADPCADGA